MKTNEIKTIETQLEMYCALGVSGYFSPEAIELRRKLNELLNIETEKILKSLQND